MVEFYKIGLQLYLAEGPEFVRRISGLGKEVFLDLKLHDIPNTVASAVASIGSLQVRMLTVHASGGSAMLQAAVQAAKGLQPRPLIIGVTVLTSLGDDELNEVGVGTSAADQVLRLSQVAVRAGCDGLVVSPQEVAAVRQAVGAKTVLITPGVRPSGKESNDQRRTATPAEALKAGSDYLVVGRPITSAADPAAAAQSILQELRQA